MSTKAADQLRRILLLIPRLADGEEHDLADIAATVGSTPRELVDDFQSLSERFDAPGGFVEGVTILLENERVSVHASHFHRPMRLTMPELCALELGLVMLRRERTPAEHAPIERSLDRLRQAVTELPSNDRHEGIRWAELSANVSPEHLAVLRHAVREQRRVRLRYRSGGSEESKDRDICPHAVAFAEQMWYVVAGCDDTRVRFFRLDRVEAVEPLDDTFVREPGLTATMERGRLFESDAPGTMAVRYSPRIARWIAEREGLTPAADGSLVVEHPVADESWAVRHVLQYGPDAELVRPASLRSLVAERLAALDVPGS